jgi:two-component system response regulator AtoC
MIQPRIPQARARDVAGRHGIARAVSMAWQRSRLRNAIERAMLLIDRDTLEPTDFTTLTRSVEATLFRLPLEGVNLEDVERQLLTQALERAGGNQSRAAQLLGINHDQVRYRLEKFGLKA